MMDRSRIKEVLEVIAQDMVKDLFISEWHIKVKQDSIDDARALCYVDPYYRTATIIIDPNEIKDERDLIETYRHELFHVVLHPIDEYRRLISKCVKKDTRQVAKEAYTQVEERCVFMLEGIFDISMKIGLDKYIALLEAHDNKSDEPAKPVKERKNLGTIDSKEVK